MKFFWKFYYIKINVTLLEWHFRVGILNCHVPVSEMSGVLFSLQSNKGSMLHWSFSVQIIELEKRTRIFSPPQWHIYHSYLKFMCYIRNNFVHFCSAETLFLSSQFLKACSLWWCFIFVAWFGARTAKSNQSVVLMVMLCYRGRKPGAYCQMYLTQSTR